MKTQTLLLLAGAAAVLFFVGRKMAGTGARTPPKATTPGRAPAGATEIVVGNSNGWRYFSDGTSISPDGTYYYQGEMLWNPMM